MDVFTYLQTDPITHHKNILLTLFSKSNHVGESIRLLTTNQSPFGGGCDWEISERDHRPQAKQLRLPNLKISSIVFVEN